MFDEITTFSFPTRIVFGRGAVRRLPACLEETGVRKPLVVTDPGLRASPAFDAVISVLKMRESAYEVFDRVHGNPVEDDVLESVELYRSAGCDGVIGLGGGSAIDVAKAVVVMARHDGPLAELEAQAGGMDRMTGPYDRHHRRAHDGGNRQRGRPLLGDHVARTRAARSSSSVPG